MTSDTAGVRSKLVSVILNAYRHNHPTYVNMYGGTVFGGVGSWTSTRLVLVLSHKSLLR